jgi:hypothetical protein
MDGCSRRCDAPADGDSDFRDTLIEGHRLPFVHVAIRSSSEEATGELDEDREL